MRGRRDAARGSLGFGITAVTREGVERIGPRVETLGFDELWANDTRAGSGLATLAGCVEGTERLVLGLGVAGLSEWSVERLADEVVKRGLPRERLVLGVGSGASHSLRLVREGVARLRRRLPDVSIAVAAVGPRMCRLGGQLADVVLCNWASPERLAWNRERVAEGADEAGRPAPELAAYVRVALGPDSQGRLADEAGRYLGRQSAYRRSFAEQKAVEGESPRPEAIPGGIAVEEGAALPAALEPYRAALDRTILRGLPASDEVDGWLQLAEAVAAALAGEVRSSRPRAARATRGR